MMNTTHHGTFAVKRPVGAFCYGFYILKPFDSLHFPVSIYVSTIVATRATLFA